nr:MAG TPA_asm: hypothetical protein [Caudoviricetes sp.]
MISYQICRVCMIVLLKLVVNIKLYHLMIYLKKAQIRTNYCFR